MGVSAKYKRKLIYNDKYYIWWVGENADDCDRIYLHIVSEDKSLILSYRVGEGDFVIKSSGRVFQGKSTSGLTEIYKYPMKEPPMVITPKFVSEIIQWAVSERN